MKQSGDSPEDQGPIRRITWIGLWVNIFLAGLKFVVGWLGMSQAVVADAVHSLSDTVTDIAILVGVKYWSAPPDEGHPYGHQRIETLVTACIGIVLAAAAVGIGYDAIVGVREAQMNQPGGIALIGALASIVLKEILYRRTRAIGKRTHSAALLANAWHHRTDALSSIPVALAVVVSMIKPAWSYIDHIGALLVTFFILHAAWRIMRPALEELSDQGASEQLREQIRGTAQRVKHLDTAHAIRTRKMGDDLYVDLHITVDGKMTVSQGHDISEAVREEIQTTLPRVVDVVVHLEPSDHTGDQEEQERNHA